jgi:hypothetical protein
MSDTATTTSVRAARLRRRSAGRLLRRVALPALLATTALVMAAPAGAYTITVSKGAPGKASTPVVYGTYGGNGSLITAPARRVTESRRYARYDQWVCVTPRLYHGYTPDWGSPDWVLDAKATNCAWIPARARYVDVPGVDFTSPVPIFAYGVTVTVTWSLSDGTVVGKRVYDYDQSADYLCQNGGCYTGDGVLGGFVMFDF